MRTHLATLLAVSLCCGSTCVDALCARADAQDYSRLHLPGPLGRYFGIGYSAGYHTCEPPCSGSHSSGSHSSGSHSSGSHSSGSHCAGPGCAELGQRVHSIAAPVYQPGTALGPAGAVAVCPQCSQPGPYSSFAPESAPAAAAPSLQHAPIQQPRREPASTGPASTGPASTSPASASPASSDPAAAGSASPSDRAGFLKRLPHPSVQGPKKAAVARSSILELEAR